MTSSKFVSAVTDIPVTKIHDPLFEFIREELKRLPSDKALKLPASNFDGRNIRSAIMTMRVKLKKAFPGQVAAFSEQGNCLIVWLRSSK